MDEYSRRTTSGLVISRKAPNLGTRDSANHTNGQVCSRAGCSSNLNSTKSSLIGSPNKAKASRTPFRSSGNGKEIIGSSSRTPAAVTSSRKSFPDSKRKQPFHVETCPESTGKAEMIVGKQSEAGSSSSGPSSRLVRRNSQRFVGPSGSNTLRPSNQGPRSNGASSSRYNLRSLRCNSSSDVAPSGSSSPVESKRDNGRKRINEPESSGSSSTARGKKSYGPPILDTRRNDHHNRGVSISDSRRSRASSASEYEEAANLRARGCNARSRVTHQDNRTRFPLIESPVMMTPSSSSPNREVSLEAMAFGSDDQFSIQSPSHRASSWTNRSTGPYEAGISRSFMNRDGLRQYNLDGIAEMLLALERIEHEEEPPSYEQLLALETSLFLGLAYNDQHREMRLDIDNMSYEELLALEERIGNVSTALSEEDLAKCVQRSIYQCGSDRSEGGDDVKCSICQEEYEAGHEVGKLRCDHRYHVECIQQWLSIKNWCPICKASAAATSSSISMP